jgi:hypothetical protein
MTTAPHPASEDRGRLSALATLAQLAVPLLTAAVVEGRLPTATAPA